MNKLNEFRSSNFGVNNRRFHERVNSYSDLAESDLEDRILFICEVDEVIVAYIQGSVHERKNHKLSSLGYIDEVYVSEDVRGKGVANRLMIELEKTFLEKGCDPY